MQTVVNSLLTHYSAQGEGKTVVLLHGWADSLSTFSKLQKDLSKNYKVISLDLPGFGQSQAPLNTWDLDDYAVFVYDFLTKIEVEEVYALVGHSNGGAIAIRGLSTDKLKAERLVLLASSGIRLKKSLRKYAFLAATKIGKVASLALPEKTRTKLRKKLYQTAKSDMLAAEHLQETFKRVVTQDIQSDAKNLTLPTLLIYGQGDADTPVLFGVRLHRLIKSSELKILDGAGHFVHQDQPEEVAKLLEKFLQ